MARAILAEKQLKFLTKDILRNQKKTINEREYQSQSEGRMKRIETAYSMENIDHSILRAYYDALKTLDLSHIAVEFVLADRT